MPCAVNLLFYKKDDEWRLSSNADANGNAQPSSLAAKGYRSVHPSLPSSKPQLSFDIHKDAVGCGHSPSPGPWPSFPDAVRAPGLGPQGATSSSPAPPEVIVVPLYRDSSPLLNEVSSSHAGTDSQTFASVSKPSSAYPSTTIVNPTIVLLQHNRGAQYDSNAVSPSQAAPAAPLAWLSRLRKRSSHHSLRSFPSHMCWRADGLPSVWGGEFELENSQD
ncbi:hypothetical protein Celaphus_00008527 [Cervus elaphus hippelaphus]|uniref:Uncharacterized protein n=1 Tax=Cervus elaphus hippelaphus TaxID=46360 RepID=A0A212CNS7_CEREH|nr:hypothetical protein Celaphus_00008527 [Cervus elaphus hippelaphus]